MKKKVLLGLSLAAVTVMLTGCLNTGFKPKSEDSSYEGEGEITIDPEYSCKLNLLIPQGNSNETTMIDKCVEGLQEHFPNITFGIFVLPLTIGLKFILENSLSCQSN